MGIERGAGGLQKVWQPEIIAVQEAQALGARTGDATVTRRWQAAVWLRYHRHTAILYSLGQRGRLVNRAVIDDYQFQVLTGLRQHRGDRRLDRARGVVRRDDHGELGCGGGHVSDSALLQQYGRVDPALPRRRQSRIVPEQGELATEALAARPQPQKCEHRLLLVQLLVVDNRHLHRYERPLPEAQDSLLEQVEDWIGGTGAAPEAWFMGEGKGVNVGESPLLPAAPRNGVLPAQEVLAPAYWSLIDAKVFAHPLQCGAL